MIAKIRFKENVNPNKSEVAKNMIVWHMVIGKIASTKLSRYVLFLIGAIMRRLINSVFLSPAMVVAVKSIANVKPNRQMPIAKFSI